jgi:hypothetical protein
MAKYEDYVKKAQEEQVGTDEIDQAAAQQEEREVSTPEVNWQKRYEDLEVAYSRQGQQMGDYRQMIDNYVSTPVSTAEVPVEPVTITSDDIYENPNDSIDRKIESHPAILEVNQLKNELAAREAQSIREAFTLKHPDFQQTYETTEFANWVNANPMREDLRQRAANFDMTAADALFTLWEIEQGASVVSQELDATNAVAQVGLESGSVQTELAPERYSRSEMLEQKIRAKQGDLAAERYVKAHGPAYREALGAGLVRD